jgi:hypothetical protein
LKNSYLDYKIFVTPEKNKISAHISGENLKHVLVGFNDTENPDLRAFLEKIMSAAKLNLQTDCLILRGLDNLPSLLNIASEYTIEHVIMFGIKPKQLGLNIDVTPYTVTHFQAKTLLFVDNMATIEQNTALKKALWECLQKVFL